MAPDAVKQHSVFNLVATVAAYLILNSTLNLMNKWLLGIYGFSFPLLLTSCHMLFSFLILLPFMLREPFKSLHAATLQKQWKGIIGIGLFMAVNIAFNNLSLVQITLSLNQVIRSFIPVICCLLAIGIENKVPSGKEIGSLVVLSLGVMIAVWEGSVNGSPHGIMLCIIGTVCNAAMMSTSGRILSEKLDVLRLAFYTAPVSCVALFPFCYFRESTRFMTYSEGQSMIVTAIILVGSINALSYNVVHYLMIQMTSAVTTTVLGEVKIVGLLVLSVLLLGEKSMFTTRMTVGVVLAVAGFCLYSHCKMSLQKRPAAPIIKGVPDLIDPGFRLNSTQVGKSSFGRKSAINIQ